MMTAYAPRSADYSDVALASLIEGASPHRLVEILYDELLKSLDSLAAADARGLQGQAAKARTRAKTILAGLDAGLDLDAGGELGTILRRFYRGGLAMLARPERAADEMNVLRTQIADIAASWSAIGVR